MFFFRSTLIKCLSSTENVICMVFCLSTSQLRHHKVRAAQVWWLNLIIELATVSVIRVQKKLVNIRISI